MKVRSHERFARTERPDSVTHVSSAARIEVLEDRIAELETIIGITGVAPWLTPNLAPQHRQLLGVLITRPLVDRALGRLQ